MVLSQKAKLYIGVFSDANRMFFFCKLLSKGNFYHHKIRILFFKSTQVVFGEFECYSIAATLLIQPANKYKTVFLANNV